MNALQNFAFEEHLVRAVDVGGEPWFVGKDVCSVLDIRDYHQALEKLDGDERGGYTIPTPSGDQTMIVISEAGIYRLVFRSRKPEAERFKRWLAHDVLPQIRRTGSYAPQPDRPVLSELAADAPLASRIDAVRLAKGLFGAERARALWQELGLPHVPPPSPFHGAGEAAECLKLLLAHDVREGNLSVRQAVQDAANGDLEARACLEMDGIRVSEDGDGFWIANTSKEMAALYASTTFARGKWQIVLRRIAGARTGDRQTFHGRQSRTIFLPFDVLDDEYLRRL